MKGHISFFIAVIFAANFLCASNENALLQIQDKTNKKLSWEQVTKQSRNAVIQIFANAKEPHYFARYKNPDDTGWAGSGFFISNNGYIFTNYHVADLGAKLFIQHPNLSKERFEVEFVGACPTKDIALLKLKDEDCNKIKNLLGVQELPYLTLGNSDDLVEAQEIMILGYPLGQENIKSSRGEASGRESTPIGECIQTTAPMNHGNSGGPVLDKFGNVIGICALGPSHAIADGIAYLIPINNAKKLLPHLKTNKIVRKPFWGIATQPINDDLIKYLRLPFEDGILVTKLYENSLFEDAGIKQGDIICGINNEKIDKFGYIQNRISMIDYLDTLEIESTVNVDIYRNGETMTIEFVIKSADSFKIKNYYYGYEDLPPYEIIGGLVITELNLNQIEQIERTQSPLLKYANPKNRFESKVIISYIIPGSEIDNSRCIYEIYPGIPYNPVIKEINGIKVSNMDEVRNAILQTQDFLTIKTQGNGLIAFSLEQLVFEDAILSQQENFGPSELVKELLERAMA